ncbi:hypothetical protein ZYGR_0I06120 [Zygosaccharomyces rouxii]|uniref:ZYRO0C14542p n=2 Tax=Zygosaccharomyces rouxii TaxID=4956 RepID=C5DU77_ZYGRC|nr:uncharacterized protein ZYRO0C14542g [Zygosaccharomyces rouxii]KAH9201488.1 hypothetical protein LQ764DRAFT_208246 [Zygosaccharomyces rouxii]GAV48315.1 hypothetical protein ZYGR_0I06120 [Zygosaccharomyces rouxii]CAR27338.1 ZYRO0C14542p [Zygosaccharomyces rouxii]
MTSSPAIEELIQKHTKMINDSNKTTVKNQKLLNQICQELTLSLCHPLLEFVDALLEKFMYPEGIEKDAHPDLFTLGHPRLLELVYLRQRVDQLQKLNRETFEPISQFFPHLLHRIEKIHIILVHLLQVLSNHIEIPTQSKFYRKIVTESISDFQRAFEQFKSLDYVLMALMRNLEKTGSTDKTFLVDSSLLQEIKNFDTENKHWFNDILQESKALKEFNQEIEDNEHSDITTFLRDRKSRLQISSRRVF